LVFSQNTKGLKPLIFAKVNLQGNCAPGSRWIFQKKVLAFANGKVMLVKIQIFQGKIPIRDWRSFLRPQKPLPPCPGIDMRLWR